MKKTKGPRALFRISFLIPVIGWWNRMVVKLPFVGKRLMTSSNRMTGKLLPKLTFLGFRGEPGWETAIWNWEVFLDLIGAEYELIASPEGRTYTFKKCPAGYCRPEHRDACLTTMVIDHTLAECSGARLIVEKRIPEDGICVEKIVPV
jgi:hypothetical protein